MTAAAKVALVTGGNKGVGYAIVRNLALKYASLYSNLPPLVILLTARNPSNGQKSVDQLEDELKPNVLTKNGGNVELRFLKLDLTDDETIKSVREVIANEYNGFDILINNAATAFKGNVFNADVVRTTFATNFYGTLNVSNHLFPLIRPGGRLINISSSAGRSKIISEGLRKEFTREDLDIDGLVGLMKRFEEAVENGTYKEEGWPQNTYSVSKVGVTIMTRVFARRANQEGKGVLVFSCCPGSVRTDMNTYGSLTIDQGAQTPVLLALDDTVVPAAENGSFWRDERVLEW